MQNQLFELALGVAKPWYVDGVDFDAAKKTLTIGVDFVAAPVTAPDVVLACEEADVPCILGGLSPTEVWRAHEMQPDFVKVTNPEALGGPPYAGSLCEPLPTLRLRHATSPACRNTPRHRIAT